MWTLTFGVQWKRATNNFLCSVETKINFGMKVGLDLTNFKCHIMEVNKQMFPENSSQFRSCKSRRTRLCYISFERSGFYSSCLQVNTFKEGTWLSPLHLSLHLLSSERSGAQNISICFKIGTVFAILMLTLPRKVHGGHSHSTTWHLVLGCIIFVGLLFSHSLSK